MSPLKKLLRGLGLARRNRKAFRRWFVPLLEPLERRLPLALFIEDFSDDSYPIPNGTPFDRTRAAYDSSDADQMTVPGGDTDADPNTKLGPDELLIPHSVGGNVRLDTNRFFNATHYLTMGGGGQYFINLFANRLQPGGIGPAAEVVTVGFRYNGVGRIIVEGANGIKTLEVNEFFWSGGAVTSNDPSDGGQEMGPILNVKFIANFNADFFNVDDISVLVLEAGFSNNAPVAEDDSVVVHAGAPQDIFVLSNDLDLDGDELSVSNPTGFLHGFADVQRPLNATPYIRYTPDAGYIGEDSFSYNVFDGRTGFDTATVFISIEAPTAVDDRSYTLPGEPIDIAVLNNDTNPGGFPLTIVIDAFPADGGVVGHDGLITYTPRGGFHGRDSFTYNIQDDYGNSSTARVDVTVNTQPTASDHAFWVPHGFTGRFAVDNANLLAGAADLDQDGVHLVTGSRTVEAGTVTINADGSFAFDPSTDDGVVLPTVFRYYIFDDLGGPGSALVHIFVENTPPVAHDFSPYYDHGTQGPVTLRLYYDDANGDAVTLEFIEAPTRGSVTLRGSGADPVTGRLFVDVEYDTPSHILLTSDQFTYRLADRYSASRVATVLVDVPNYSPQVIIPAGSFSRSYFGGLSILTPTGSAPVSETLFEFDNTHPNATGTITITPFGNEIFAFDVDGDAVYPILEDRPQHGVVTFSQRVTSDGQFYDFDYIPRPRTRVTEAGLAAAVQDVFAALPDERNAAIVAAVERLAALAGAEFFSTDEFLDAADELLRDVPAGESWEPFRLTADELQTFRAALELRIRPDESWGTDTFSYRLSDGIEESLDEIYVIVQQSLGIGIARSDIFWTTDSDDPAEEVEVALHPRTLVSNDKFASGFAAIAYAQGVQINGDDLFTFTEVIESDSFVGLDEPLVYRRHQNVDPGAPRYREARYAFLYPAPVGQSNDFSSSSSATALIAIFDDPQLDPDGVSDAVESDAPRFADGDRNGDGVNDRLQFTGDGNFDGILDSQQSSVVSLPNANGDWLTLVSTNTTSFWDVKSDPIPTPQTTPANFPLGSIQFGLAGLSRLEETTVTLYPYADVLLNTYYSYGVEVQDNPSTPGINEAMPPHWYEFLYDGTTGAQIFYEKYGRELADNPSTPDFNEATADHWYAFIYDPTTDGTENVRTSQIVLNLKDDDRGDFRLIAGGLIVHVGGPGFVSGLQPPNIASILAPSGDWLRIESPAGTRLVGLLSVADTAESPTGSAPRGFNAGNGLYGFTVLDVPMGGAIDVEVTFEDEFSANSYLKKGPTYLGDPDEVIYYEFLSDGSPGSLGATLFDDDNDGNLNRVVLHLQDGGLGDHDLIANGVIVDPGGPAVRLPPMGVADAYEIDEDQPLTVAVTGVLANDLTPTGEALTAVLVTDVAHGMLSLQSDGSFRYLPALNFNGIDSFSYKATDGRLDSDVAVVTITVNPVNDAPIASASGPPGGLRGRTLTFVLGASDAEPADQAAGFAYHLDWNGDGTVDQFVTGPSGTQVDHVFAQSGSFAVRIIAADQHGAVSEPITHSIVITDSPPIVERVIINDGSAQRSMINSLTVTFNRPVVVDAGAFQLWKQGWKKPLKLELALSEQSGRTLASLTFKSQHVVGGSLPDGDYRLVIRGDKIRDAAGRLLDGDRDAVAGGNHVDEFFRRFGDSDGDGDVDRTDKDVLETTFGKRSRDRGYLWYLDYNANGRIWAEDLALFLLNYGRCERRR